MAACRYCGNLFSPDNDGYCLACGPDYRIHRTTSSGTPREQRADYIADLNDPANARRDRAYYESIPKSGGPNYIRKSRDNFLLFNHGEEIPVAREIAPRDSHLLGKTVVFCDRTAMKIASLLSEWDDETRVLKINAAEFSRLTGDQVLTLLHSSQRYIAIHEADGKKTLVEGSFIQLEAQKW